MNPKPLKRMIGSLKPSWFPRPPDKRVRALFEAGSPPENLHISLSEHIKRSCSGDVWLDSSTIKIDSLGEVRRAIDLLFRTPGGGVIAIDVNPEGDAFWLFFGDETGKNAKDVTIFVDRAVHLAGGVFGTISICNSGAGLYVTDSVVRNFKSMAWKKGVTARASFSNTWVHHLELYPESFADFLFVDGGILRVVAPGPLDGNPFKGSVVFSDVFLPRTRKKYPMSGAQPFRNMRYHLTQLQNGPAASVFHSAELAVERDDERGFSRLFNFLYEEFSDYGASPSLPIVWLFLLWAFTAILLFGIGVEVGGDVARALGWQSLLYQSDWKGDFLRAVIVGFQPISWLGALISPGQSVPMAPQSLLLQIWLVIDGILSTVLLALFIFALRRRFRLAA